MFVEAKTPYGPFKDLTLKKNDTPYIREIRALDSNYDSIDQLGAVYDATLTTYKNCPDFRFLPGEYVYLFVPDFGFSHDKNNLAYKLGVGGRQIITNVTHTFEIGDADSAETSVTMRWINNGATGNQSKKSRNREEINKCNELKAKLLSDTGTVARFKLTLNKLKFDLPPEDET